MILRYRIDPLPPPNELASVNSHVVADRKNTHLQNQQLWVFLRQLRNYLVHLFTWFGPRCPEVNERYAFQVLRQDILELGWRFDYVEVGRRCHDRRVMRLAMVVGGEMVGKSVRDGCV